MNHSASRAAVGIAFGLFAVGAACSTSTPVDESGNGSGGSGANVSGKCTKSQLKILFTPMFSAFDGRHPFKIPVVANGIDATAVSFAAEDPAMVDIDTPDPDTGIAMITVHKAGSVNIVATAGDLCGVSLLTITESTPDDWETGNARYNNGIVLPPRGGGPRSDAGPTDGPSRREVACTNCHGDTALTNRFRTVAHTPQQTGGFSDEELQNVFRHGMVPAGKAAYFDFGAVQLTQEQWNGLHQWDMTDAQAKGIVTFLRGLPSTPQTGMRGDFGGGFNRPDGGRGPRGDGGRGQRDGGAAPGDVDAAASD